MPTNKGHHAIKNYLNELQKIVSCVASEVCYVYPNNSGRQVLAWSGTDPSDPQPLMLKRKNNSKLFIDISQEIQQPNARNDYLVSTKSYMYSILDAEKKDLIGFHYHPELDDDPVMHPHIHVYADADKRFADFNLHKRHIPSGRVALEDVIEWLIVELEVKALRSNWQQILQTTRKKFKRICTWS